MRRELLEQNRELRQLSAEACQKAGTIACALCNACPLAAVAPQPSDALVSSSDQSTIRALLDDDAVGSIGFQYDSKLRSPHPAALPLPPISQRKIPDTPPKPSTKSILTPSKPPIPRNKDNGETLSEVFVEFFALVFGLKSLAKVSKSPPPRR